MSVVIAVDSTETAELLVPWTLSNLNSRTLHIIKAAPKGSSRTDSALDAARDIAVRAGADADSVHAEVVSVTTGALNPGQTIAAFAEAKGAELLVVGSRGIGAVAGALLSLLGLGSVSAAVLAAADVPVAVIRKDVQLSAAPAGSAPRHICIAVDGSPEAKHALAWVLQHVFRPDADYLDIVSVATLTEPFTKGAVSYMERRKAAVSIANDIAFKAGLQAAEHGVSPKHIKCSALDPVSDGTSNVSGALIKHVTAYQANMLVVGRRGQSPVKQAAMSMAGLGSVSSTCVGSAPCPVLVTVLPRAPA